MAVVVGLLTTGILLRSSLLLCSALLPALCRGHGDLVQPIEVVSVPQFCEERSESGDHLLVRYSLKSTNPDKAPLFSMASWEQQHLQLGSPDTPSAFNEGLLGMCAGERRRLTFSGHAFGLSEAEAAGAPTVVSEVELLTLTTEGDFHVFDLIDKGDVGAIMEMVDNHAGVNAVDRHGNSALMAAVQGGSRMQMVVATLLNAWRPKADVDFVKPSGHSVLFYAATQVRCQRLRALPASLSLCLPLSLSLSLGVTLLAPLHRVLLNLNAPHPFPIASVARMTPQAPPYSRPS